MKSSNPEVTVHHKTRMQKCLSYMVLLDCNYLVNVQVESNGGGTEGKQSLLNNQDRNDVAHTVGGVSLLH